MMKGYLAWIIFTLAAAACLLWIGFGVRDDLREDDVFHDIVSERLDYAEDPDEEIRIGVAGDFGAHKDVLLGVELAAEEINADGGILGHTIILDAHDDKGTVEDSLAVAQQFASDPEIGFVIGHTHFEVNDDVAQNYEFYGILRISPNTFGNARTGFKLLFENGIKPELTSQSILDIAAQNDWRRLGLIYTKNKQAMQHARQFESLANKQGIKIPLAFAFEGRGSGISRHMERWKRELDLNAIVLAVDGQDAAGIISACRAVGINCPVILLAESTAIAGKAAPNMGTVYVMQPPRTDALYLDLAKAYRARYGKPVTVEALLGFDSLHILKQAITKANSFVPSKVAEFLKREPVIHSVSGTVDFDEQGAAIRTRSSFSLFQN